MNCWFVVESVTKPRPAFLDSCFDLQSQFNAVPADLIIKSVCKKRFKLQSQQASFGQYGAALLHDRAEIVF